MGICPEPARRRSRVNYRSVVAMAYLLAVQKGNEIKNDSCAGFRECQGSKTKRGRITVLACLDARNEGVKVGIVHP